jgi:hypothetical protein
MRGEGDIPKNQTTPSPTGHEQKWDLVEIPRMELIVQTPGYGHTDKVGSE